MSFHDTKYIYSQLAVPLFLLQTSYHDRLCLLFPRVGQVGEGDGLNVGESHNLPPTTTVSHALSNPSRAVLPYQPQGLGRETESAMTSPSY